MELYTMNAREMSHAKATGARVVKILPPVTYTAGLCPDCGQDNEGEEWHCEEDTGRDYYTANASTLGGTNGQL